MRKNDANDLKPKFFRTGNRFFQINGQWYFSAREGEIGPFRTRHQAESEVRAYIMARQAGEAARGKLRRDVSEPTVIPGYIYRSVLSLQQRVADDRYLVLDDVD